MILIADDEQPLVNFLSKGLRSEGYECVAVSDLHEVLPCVKQFKPDVLVLDRMFGSQDSLTVISAIKSEPHSPMILMLTALDEVGERIKGLQKGADDYLCKPFDFDELLARVEALRRRSNPHREAQHQQITAGSLTVLPEQRIVKMAGHEVALTKIEYELLYYLVQNKGKVMSRERILARVWNTHSDPQTNIIDVYISKLRKKLESDSDIVVETLRGNGYRLNVTL